jgi:hypothetical protein
MGLRLQAPCPRQAGLVAKLFEDGDRAVCGGEELIRRDLGLGEQAQKAALHEGLGSQSAVTGGGSGLDSLGQCPVGPRHIVAHALHRADVGNEIHAQRIVRRQQGDGA